MENPAITLLRNRNDFWAQVEHKRGLGRTTVSLLVFIILSSAAYGAVLAGWRSPQLALYVAVKLPLLLIGTTSLVMLLNWIFATFAASGLSFRQVVAITYAAMGVACWILLGLLPVTAFMTFGVAQDAGTLTHAQLQFTHNCLLLTHVLLIALAGIAGNSALRQGLRKIINPACPPNRIYWSWIFSFTLVGCQLSWILRPFIGSPFYKIEFMRPDALKSNFFEFIFREIIPFVIKGG